MAIDCVSVDTLLIQGDKSRILAGRAGEYGLLN